jgi:hypothetical protein
VQFALLCEGSTDLAALPALVEKAIQGLLAEDGVHAHFEWNIAPGGVPSDDRIGAAAQGAAYDVVLAHRDGAGRSDEVRKAILALGAVPVVPVREMEAWLIAEPEAFSRAARVPPDRLPAGLPRGRAAETVADPKVVMDEILAACFRKPPRGGRFRDLERYLEIVAAEVRLPTLRELTAFLSLMTDLRDALTRMGWPFR